MASPIHIERSALVLHPAELMFDLVNDIEAYPRFMEGCHGVAVLSRSDQEVVARLDLARGGVRQSFTTRNRLLRPESIDMQLVEGPFSAFAGRWTFKALTDSACKVSLRLEFVFKSELVSIAGSSLFKRVANNLVNATTREADRIATG